MCGQVQINMQDVGKNGFWRMFDLHGILDENLCAVAETIEGVRTSSD